MAKVRKNPGKWLAMLALLALFSSLISYTLVHRPFAPELAVSIAGALWEILITAMIVTLGAGLGARTFPSIGSTALSRLVLQSALGLGLWGILFLGVGGLFGLNSLLIWATSILAFYFLRISIRKWFEEWGILRKYWNDSGRLGRTLAIPIVAILFSSLLVAIAPPLRFDSLVYHLALPEYYQSASRFIYSQANIFWGFPQLPHMLSTWALALGVTTGALIGWAMGVLCILGLLALVGEHLGPRRAWVAVASLLAGASLAASLGWGYVNWPSMLFAWGMIYLLNDWVSTRERKSLLLVGAFAGLAFGTKYTAGILAPLGLVFILLHAKTDWKRALPFLLAALAFATPWLLKNIIATGNPVYPLLFIGGAMDEFRIKALQALPIQSNWLDLVFLPIRATFWGHESGHVGDAPGYEASIGPLLLSLGLFAGWGRAKLEQRARQLLQLCTVFTLGGLLIWAVAGRLSGHLVRTHLYYSIFPAFAILAAFGFAALERIKLPGLRMGRVVSALVLFTLVLTSTQVSSEMIKSGANQHLLGQIGDQEYLERNLGLYALVMRSLKDELPANAQVLMLWETRGYYCQPICDSDEVIDRWRHDLDTFDSPANVLQAWQSQGFTHLLYFRKAAEFVAQDSQHFHPLDLIPLEGMLTSLPLVRDYNADYGLYALSQ